MICHAAIESHRRQAFVNKKKLAVIGRRSVVAYWKGMVVRASKSPSLGTLLLTYKKKF